MAELDPVLLGAALLAAVALGAVVYVFLEPYLSGQRKVEKRLATIAEGEVRSSARRGAAEQASARRKAVADSLKDLESRQKDIKKVSMRLRLERAGMNIPMKSFYISSAITGVVCTIFAFISFPTAPLAAPIIGFVGAFGLPRWYIGRATKRRQAKFLKEFANAIDVIVRGIKSGLPLNECLSIIARESPDPISTEFAEVVDQQRVGVPISECLERMMERVPLAEVKFFAVVVAIQQKAGGNLSEALGNLSGVLRDRIRLQLKVKAMSAEAKASAGVLASLPPIVGLLVYLTSPQYIELLWITPKGRFMLLICAFWMFCGIMVMRKMINFKF
ncbi:MAG: type II secretion system F family protein [Hyphomicrobiaceae bacterium]|nr:type II secretion system F family protein [Hyphomicrobiaceae bacterium]